MQKIEITNLSKLKITKIKPHKLYFKYNNEDYMLIYYSEDETVLKLYKRIWVSKDRLVLEHLNSISTSYSIDNLYKDISKRHPTSVVYSNIDKLHFVKTLVKLGFVDGKYYDEYRAFMDKEAQKYTKELQEILNKYSADEITVEEACKLSRSLLCTDNKFKSRLNNF